ncbi:baseplate J/gp47 family protein [Paenibacillus thalictri]|uniref:Uncharacterized protein n=1 Tax=Paenibacillus thalictri TaxID=2527873 RepID=A0A4Q9DUW4_9BACL|nr:baseplate J/gp47 family protein [Paenibacillus thalictri]TBL80769.1 hypothetical protein EYB31_05970 [Paenibacillus thalictri]
MPNQSAGGGTSNHYPVIDERNMARLTEQIRLMAPFYTPEWSFSPDDPDPGTALSLMFAHMLEGNIRRLNQVPYKSFLSFLNRFHVELAQARPAMAQVTFRLTEGTPESVYVEKGTQLAASVPGESVPILFETARPVLLTTARLTDLLTMSPRHDRIVRLAGDGTPLEWARDGRGTALFGMEGDNLQSHAMYLQHGFLFRLDHPAYVELLFFNAVNEYAVNETVDLLTDGGKVKWEYHHAGEWLPFDRVYGSNGVIRLVKLQKRSIDPFDFNGHYGYWIRCRAMSLDESSGGALLSKVQMDRFVMKSDFAAAADTDGILPDRLYFNDIQVDAEDGCQPFGDFFAHYGLFYIANKEAFSKRGADITVRFRLSFQQNRLIPGRPPQINWKMIMKRHEVDKTEIPDPVTISSVQWEYWNGTAWVKLPVSAEAQKLFSDPWEGIEERELTFVCPEDLQEIFVNAEESFWIRGRIVQIQNAYSPNAIYYTPIMEGMRLRYSYVKPLYPPQRLFVQNNLEQKERTVEVSTGGVTFRPFVGLEGRYPAMWLGFDAPPVRGPISMYVTLNQRRTTADDIPFLEWEYLRAAGNSAVWAPLAVADGTNGLTRSGDVQFIGPHDFALASYFGAEKYWIRVLNRDGRYDEPHEAGNVPRALSMTLNTTLAVQQKTVRNELPQRVTTYETAEVHTNEYFVLSETPVLDEEVWVDETGGLPAEEISELERADSAIEVIRDSEGNIMRVWVRYKRADQFLRSRANDRHYMIDRATGRLMFGNGAAGRKPPLSGEDTVRVTYSTGGGKRGNVPVHSITKLQDSIAFIDQVTNPLPAAGGCDSGTVEEAIVRGPKRFSHLRRAVTAEDYEWLTREAHQNVAKVKCLPNVNVKLEPEPGSMSIVVLPKSGLGNGAHFQELKRTVEEKLLAQSAATMAFPGSLQVMEPALLEICVQATVWVRGMDEVVPAEREIVRKLQAFLDPLTGNADGRGWDIGQAVHHSMFYSLLKSVSPVVHIPQLAIHVYKAEYGERIEWQLERMAEIRHGIIVPGEHRISVELKK